MPVPCRGGAMAVLCRCHPTAFPCHGGAMLWRRHAMPLTLSRARAALCRWCHASAVAMPCHHGCAAPVLLLVLARCCAGAGAVPVLAGCAWCRAMPAVPDGTGCPQVRARAVPAPRRPLLQLPVPRGLPGRPVQPACRAPRPLPPPALRPRPLPPRPGRPARLRVPQWLRRSPLRPRWALGWWVPAVGSPMPGAGLSTAVPQSWSAAGSRCGTTTRCSGATPSARRRGRWPGWSAGGPAAAPAPAAAPGCGSGAGNTPSSAAMARPLWRRWRSPASAAAASACERPPAPESRGAGGEPPLEPRTSLCPVQVFLNCSCAGRARQRVEPLHLEGWETKKHNRKEKKTNP